MSEDTGVRERVVGALVALAAGDALGVPVEFEPRDQREADPVRGLRGGGTWKLEPGTWSDDTSLALCLAESIVLKGFDPEDSGRRSLAWMDKGLWAARGAAFGVGGATRRALGRIRAGMPAVLAGGRGENDNGNGSLMRILPASIWLGSLPEPERFRAIAAYSSTTHGHARSVLGCWLHALVAGRLLRGERPPQAYAAAMEEARSLLPTLPPSARSEAASYSRVLDGGLSSIGARAVRGSGYVVHCLEASLWCLLTTGSLEDCVLAAVNLGEDADTTGAVAGGLAGLAYGRGALPAEWTRGLARLGEIEELANGLADLIEVPAPLPRSYWVLPGKLLAGGYPGRGEDSGAAVDSLLAAGVDAFIDLTAAGEELGAAEYAPRLAGRPASRRPSPMEDMSAGQAAVQAALQEIDSLLASGKTVYVHCLGGLGRTGTVIASYLADKGLAPPDEAVALVGRLRASTDTPTAQSPQTEEQRRLVAARRPGPSALALY